MKFVFEKPVFVKGPIALLFLLLLTLLGLACQRPAAPDPQGLSWEAVLEQARGSRVTFAMWGGDERINSWIDGFVAERMSALYGVQVQRIAMDAPVFVNKLAGEKAVGQERGTLDLLWINGENFARARDQDLLYGPFAQDLPNWSLVDPQSVQFDFGRDTEGYEAPYGKAQLVLEYDSARVTNPPRSYQELDQWVRENPGRFTYPQIPDFTGSAFVRQAFYALAGGHQDFLQGFDRSLYESRSAALWTYLEDLRPYLWQEGRIYPTDKAQLDALFERGEVDFNISYHQGAAQGLILSGRYPETVRTLVMEGNSLSNIHYTAIPFNSPNKAGALVLANFLMSPEAQLDKNRPEVWGDFTILDLERLVPADRQAFGSLDLGAATLPLEVLGANAVPEVVADYVEALEADWNRRILEAP